MMHGQKNIKIDFSRCLKTVTDTSASIKRVQFWCED